MKPVVGPVPRSVEAPRVNGAPERLKWTFSFRFFRQPENFGLGQQDAAWFSSLLSRLSDLSNETLADLKVDAGKRKAWRYHAIDWEAKNIPVSRKDFDWIDSDYLSNDDEYPFYQFQISKALGRVVGFLDELQTFNIVVLDPNHNFQPSDYSDYKVRGTKAAPGPLGVVWTHFEKSFACCGRDCPCRANYADLQAACSGPDEDGSVTLIVQTSADTFAHATEMVKNGAADSVGEILEVGLSALAK